MLNLRTRNELEEAKRELEKRRRNNSELWRQIEADRHAKERLAKEFRRLSASIEHGIQQKQENERQIRYLEEQIKGCTPVVDLIVKVQAFEKRVNRMRKKIKKGVKNG